MKMELLSGLVCGVCFSSCAAQITVDHGGGQKSDYVCRPGWAIGAANGDPNARTFEEIFTVNQKLAKSGNTDAAFSLGQAYVEGIGVGRDPKRAIYWFEIGATTQDEKAFEPICLRMTDVSRKIWMLLRAGTRQLDGPLIFLSWLKAIVWPLHRNCRRLYRSIYRS